jgi:16S rRNA (adenine1518-N6/adenine1519-N6)-dimethyltransferase
MPAPEVDSSVIRLDLTKREDYGVTSEKTFFAAVKAGFSERRKQIVNPLSSAFTTDKTLLKQKLQELGISQTARAEELTMKQWAGLSNCLIKGI